MGPTIPDTDEANRNEVGDLRRRVIELTMAFSRMRPLIAGIRHITANADVTAARIGSVADAFGVVVREFDSVGGSLLDLVTAVETELAEMAGIVSLWMAAEHRLCILGRTLDAVDGGAGTYSDLLRRSLLSPAAAQDWASRRDSAAEAGADDTGAALAVRVWEAAIRERRMVLARLNRLQHLCDRLGSRIERVSRVAGRQASFVGVNARIEASRAGVPDLGPIVERLTSVAEEVRSVDAEAQAATAEVSASSSAILAPLRREAAAAAAAAF